MINLFGNKEERLRKEKAGRTITVKGTGSVFVKPDLTVVTFRLRAQEKEYEAALASVAEQTEGVRAALAAAGFEDDALKTLSFRTRAEYEYVQDALGRSKQVFAGYVSEHELKTEFPTDVRRLSALIAAAAESGAAPETEVQFRVRDEKAAVEQLLARIAASALHKAEVLARSSGVVLGALVRVDYQWSDAAFVSPTAYSMDRKCLAAPEAALSLAPDDVELSDSAAFTWRIADPAEETL